MSCPGCGRAFEELDPRLFSFNSPHGACEECGGYGEIWDSDCKPARAITANQSSRTNWRQTANPNGSMKMKARVPACRGRAEPGRATCARSGIHDEISPRFRRAKRESLRGNFGFAGRRKQSQKISFQKSNSAFISWRTSGWVISRSGVRRKHSAEVNPRESGWPRSWLEAAFSTRWMSRQSGCTPRDNFRLLETLVALRKKGNSLVIVEHDEETMRRADHVVDLGPRAGVHGGEVVAQGTLRDIESARNPRRDVV